MPMRNRYFDFLTINESDRFLFFSFWHDRTDQERRILPHYFGYFDKKTNTVKISEVDQSDRSKIINDIDDFAPFYPFLWSINQSGELVTCLEADDILAWLKENPDKVKNLPKHLQELSKLKTDDNQVVVIAKLKK